MTDRRTLMATGFAALATFGITQAAPATAQEDYFAGKTVTLVLAVPAGSGGDAHGRITAQYLEKHIPGNPTVIVNNKPGGAGAIALNFVYGQADPDGLTLFYGGWNAPAVLEGAEGIRYVPENMGAVGSAGADLSFVVTREAVPTLEALRENEIVVGGRGATRAIEVLGNLSLKVLDVPFRYVGGFGGFSKIQAAIKAGEVQGGHAGLPGYVKFFGPDSDLAWAAYYHPAFDAEGNVLPRNEGAYPDSTVGLVEAHGALHGSAPEGQWWEAYKWHQMNIMSATTVILSPPETPAEILSVLQQAYQDVAADPEFLAEYERQIGVPPVFNSTAATEQIFENYRNAPQEVQDAIAEISRL